MTNLDSILKSRDITLPTKVCLVKAMVFPVVVYRCESWESWALKNWYFWTVVLEKTLENPLDFKEIKPVNPKENQSWVFIGRTDAEAPILWPPDATHWKRPWCWERLKAGGDGGDRGGDDWMASLTSMDMSLSKLQEMVKDKEAWCATVYGDTKNWTWLSDWTTKSTINVIGLTSSRF